MGRESWRDIRDDIAGRIARGELKPGSRLPIEPELAREFGVGRHSVRRAIRELALEGKLKVVQGNGTFIQNAPLIEYHIGRRTRFRKNLREQGVTPSGEHIANDIRPAPDAISAILGIETEAPVHRLVRRGLADGVPISLGIGWFPVARFPDLGARRAAGESVSDIYRDHGIADYFRRRTTIFTRRPEPEEAALLSQHPESPVLVVTKADVTADGTVIGYSEAVWAGDRVKFTLDTEEEDRNDV
ncbi:phosphonate metabolism transcriptional regulator PhnF [Halovulum dunhuangense]|uniref:Phosphonate metabolism transcriptional regulator PhnF n=1 Tax=Halovulum dunhuangense TaxID=1505036 RepID=A0A849L211_9RHOB|nr:phosphonate metabolism transcriptional regulator PhnF [Halovulum dunhuangense]